MPMIDSTLLAKLKSKAHLLEYLEQSKNEIPLYTDVLDKYYYERLLLQLQAELVDFQKWVQQKDKKLPSSLKVEMLQAKVAPYAVLQNIWILVQCV